MSRLFLVCALVVFASTLSGQQSKAGASSQAGIPRLIKFNGDLRDLSGKPVTGPVDVTFSLYTDETGGNALWFETQTVQADALGHYTVLLGAMTPAGVPMELFTSGEAHWLGVQVANLPEQTRVLLVSVPYAMKAGDAETLGGKPASDYLLASQAGSQSTSSTTTLTNLITKGSTTTTTTSQSPVTNTITASYIPVFTDSLGTTGNSIMFQSGTKIGINTNTPATNLDLNGAIFMLGPKAAASGQGGTMRFRDDTGTQRWLFGIPGVAASQDFFMYNYTNGHSPLFIQNGAASYSLYLSGTGNVGIGTSSPAAKLDVNGNMKSSGTISGNGSGLTSLNASNLASGTVPSARLSGTYSGAVTFSNASNVLTGNGSALTNLSGANVTGTVASATNALSLGGVAAANFARRDTANTFTGDQTINGSLTISTDQTVSGNLNLTGTLNGWIITPYTSSSCSVLGTSYTTCISGNVLGGYTGLGGKSSLSSVSSKNSLTSRVVQGKTVLASVTGGNTIVTGVIGGTVSGGGGSLDGGSYANTVTNNWATVSGGALNLAGDDLAPDDPSAGCCQSVGGGAINTASGFGATVAGGGVNTASGGLATIAGGAFNNATDNGTTVGGGSYNNAGNTSSPGAGAGSTIAGGTQNTASANLVVIGGGAYNTASGDYSIVPGGSHNTASGIGAFAAGCQANATFDGAFVWSGHGSGTSCTTLTTSAAGQFVTLAPGGYFLFSSTGGAGVTVAAGSGSWSSMSDRNSKENFQPAQENELLARLNTIPISTWNYKSQDRSIRHIGPMAQDFYAAFRVGEDDKHISVVDADGVALAAIQALYKMVQSKDEQIQALGKQLEELRGEVEQLKKATESK